MVLVLKKLVKNVLMFVMKKFRLEDDRRYLYIVPKIPMLPHNDDEEGGHEC